MYSKLIRDIKDAMVQGRGNVPKEFVIDLAAEYAEACEKINARLGEVKRLLASGHRDEAVQLAEQRPKLLEGGQQLDFPERNNWLSFLSSMDLELPPNLDTSTAEQLEDAYDNLRKLEPLLVRNRLLALAQAPLRARLHVLRKLNERDPMNPIWIEDVESLERARMDQIRVEFNNAKKLGDADCLQELKDEINDVWEVPFPKDLRKRIFEAETGLSRERAREQMLPIADQLNECLVAYDALRGRGLRDQWNELNEVALLESNDPLLISVSEPFAWLVEEDLLLEEMADFDNAAIKIERAVEAKCSLDELERQIYEIQKFERELPAALVQRITHYRDNLKLSAKRTMLARIAAVVAILAVVVSAVVWFVLDRQHKTAIADAASQLSGMEDDFEGAKRFFDGLPDPIQSSGEVIAAWSQAKSKNEQVTLADSRFAATLAEFDLEGPLDKGKDNQLENLESLADSDDELVQVEQQRTKLRTEREKRAAERNKAFLERVSELIASVQEFESQSVDDTSDNDLQKMRDDVEVWMARMKGITDGLPTIQFANLQQAELIVVRLDRRIRELERTKGARLAMRKLDDSIGNIARYSAELNKFSNDFLENKYSADFKAVAQEKELWLKLEAWQSLAKDNTWDKLEVIDKAASAALLKRVESVKNMPTTIGFAEKALAAEEYLRSIAESKVKTAKELSVDIKNFCNQATFRLQKVLINNDGEYYYLSEPPSTSSGVSRIRYYNNVNDIDETKYKSFRDHERLFLGLAGHCNISDKLVKLKPDGYTRVGDYGLELIQLALETKGADLNSKVDPVPRGLILDFVLDVVAESDSTLKDDLRALRVELTALQVASTNWFDPGNGIAYDKRKLLDRDVFPMLKSKIESLMIKRQSVASSAKNLLDWRRFSHLNWTGYLRKGEDKSWRVIAAQPVAANQKLWSLVPIGGGTQSAELSVVGRALADGTIEIEPSAESRLQSGRPVFVLTE